MLLAPFMASFADELEKISMAGAIIGGIIGSKIPGNTLINAGAGALAGHGVGAALKGAKRVFWDENQAREHNALYNYTPSYSRQDQLGNYF